jgi:hypothetical protein
MTGMVRGVMVWLAAWCLYCSPGMAADWPTEGGGNARLSSSAERLALPLKLQWTYQAPAAPQLAWSRGSSSAAAFGSTTPSVR